MTTESDPTIQRMVDQRRVALGDSIPHDRGKWGLALSGGGIRSATFCLGLIKALAKQKQFHQFDLMSTVSGGGYTGSSIGKLFQENNASSGQGLPPLTMEKKLADMDSTWWLNWLRANGRYLTPGGLLDMLHAFSTFGRNLLAIHIELALMGLLLGCLLVGFDLLVWVCADNWAQAATSAGPSTALLWSFLQTATSAPTPFIFLPVLVLLASILCCAYWLLPDGQHGSARRAGSTLTVCLVTITVLLFIAQKLTTDGSDLSSLPVSYTWGAVITFLTITWAVGAGLAMVMSRTGQAPDIMRNSLTRALTQVLCGILLVLILGCADLLAWYLAKHEHAINLGPVLVVLSVALRAALPMSANVPKSLPPIGRKVLFGCLNIAGLLVLAALTVFWISIVHELVTLELFRDSPQAFYKRAALAWCYVAVPVVFLMLFSHSNRAFLNRSSLHFFYRARLIRTYLGACNHERMKNSQGDVLSPRIPDMDDLAVSVPEANDDTAFSGYSPHEHGGPIHLINICINQTRDPRGGIFNRDRKGEPMTVGPGGIVRLATDGWRQMAADHALNLGNWTAISGAAFAPGLGATTLPGLAARMTLAGIRLGYWWDSGVLGNDVHHGKYRQLVSELLGSFEGRDCADWFLSDGGHFDNTGAYALLREECELIVLADCGADPGYAFEDLENLIRKARIDLNINIVFQRPRSLSTSGAFGSLADLASNNSDACLALAKIQYSSGKSGYLILVKPNLCNDMPVDLLNYKSDNPLFPQEPTTDQFFSEAQWESYFQLGYRLGDKLLLAQNMAIDVHFSDFTPEDGATIITTPTGDKQLKPNSGRIVSRLVSSGAVSATLSFGAIASLGLGAWQAIDTIIQRSSQSNEAIRANHNFSADLLGTEKPRPPCEPRYWVRSYDRALSGTDNCSIPLSVAINDKQHTESKDNTISSFKKACHGYTVFVQVYDSDSRSAARVFRERWSTPLGANVPDIEDVVQSARRMGRRVPTPYNAPTILRYSEEGMGCSQALANDASTRDSNIPVFWNSTWSQKALAGAPDKKIIEVWLPPEDSIKQTDTVQIAQ
ncbi:patatin-like phospholipase family protein [Pseudomonas putida]|nr:patatin-like phospholipase family protein [Pseudomonas putida]HDS0964982.1 patatin-like phospholipase family protein [Pseudomonas putida]HDS0991364.1 patatin-like phospholipase family protein [Pseudomonas putida]